MFPRVPVRIIDNDTPAQGIMGITYRQRHIDSRRHTAREQNARHPALRIRQTEDTALQSFAIQPAVTTGS